MPGQISFRPTIEDFVAANRAWYWRSMRRGRFLGVTAAGEGAVALIGAAITWSEPDRNLALVVTGGMCLGFLVWMLVRAAASYALQPLAARKLFRQHRTIDRDFDVAWDETGTRFTTTNGHSATPWHDYHAWHDGRRVALLMLNDRLFHFVPHRVLSAEQLADLRAVASRAGEAPPAGE